MITRYSNTIFTAILLLALLPPFFLMAWSRDLEPYPALILPGGKSKIKIGDHDFRFKVTRIWGQEREEGSWEQIDPAALLFPIPTHFLHAISKNQFGLLQRSHKIIRSNFTDTYIRIPYQKIEADDVISSRRWLKQKLERLGYRSSYFRIGTDIFTMSRERNRITDMVPEDERTYGLGR